MKGTAGGSALAGALSEQSGQNPYLFSGIAAHSKLQNIEGPDDDNAQDADPNIFNGTSKVNIPGSGAVDTASGDQSQGGADPTDPSQLTDEDKKSGRTFGAKEIDYTNENKYLAGVAGVTLSRLVAGGKDSGVDGRGAQIANSISGAADSGGKLTPQAFQKLSTNLKSAYSQAGIKSKADLYQLANQGYAENRIDEADLAATHVVGDMIYDKNGLQKAQSLLPGRTRGIQVAQAGKTHGKNLAAKGTGAASLTPPGKPQSPNKGMTAQQVQAKNAGSGPPPPPPPTSDGSTPDPSGGQ